MSSWQFDRAKGDLWSEVISSDFGVVAEYMGNLMPTYFVVSEEYLDSQRPNSMNPSTLPSGNPTRARRMASNWQMLTDYNAIL
jgi:hypothetical protein